MRAAARAERLMNAYHVQAAKSPDPGAYFRHRLAHHERLWLATGDRDELAVIDRLEALLFPKEPT